MGWNQQCKKIRRNLFKGIKKDHPQEREYEEIKTIYKNAVGYKFKRITKVSTGLHKQYRLLKKSIRNA